MMRCLVLVVLASIAVGAPGDKSDSVNFGTYSHFLASKEKAKLKRKAITLLQKLRGLYYRCPRCKGSGKIWVIIKPRYYDEVRCIWVEAQKEKQDCSRCRGERMLFSDKVAGKFLGAGLETGRHRQASSIRRKWLRRLKDCRVGFKKTPRLRTNIDGRFGTVTGGKVALYPLHFVLAPDGRKFEWQIYEPAIHGPQTDWAGVPRVSGIVNVKKVLAADLFELKNGLQIRLAGVVVPTVDNKIPKTASRPDENARDHVKAMIEGKDIAVTPDKFSKMTLDGRPLVFVEFGGKDLGTELITAGILRNHRKHRHMKSTAYGKSETEARKAKRGCWAD